MDIIPGQRYDPNELVECPYDEVHRVRICRMPYHLLKCAKQHPNEDQFAICPFNARHVIPLKQQMAHLGACPDKPVSEYMRKSTPGKVALPDNSAWKPPDAAEAWDNEILDGEGYMEPYDADQDNESLRAACPQYQPQPTAGAYFEDDDFYHRRPHDAADRDHELSRDDDHQYLHHPHRHYPSVKPKSSPHASRRRSHDERPPTTRSRPPFSSLLADSSMTSMDHSNGPVSLSAVGPTALAELTGGKRSVRALGKCVLAEAAREGAQERPLDIAAWCDQQTNIAQSHAGLPVNGPTSEDSGAVRRPGIAPAADESSGYVRLSRGRGQVLTHNVPLRRPGTGRSAPSQLPPQPPPLEDGSTAHRTPSGHDSSSLTAHQSSVPCTEQLSSQNHSSTELGYSTGRSQPHMGIDDSEQWASDHGTCHSTGHELPAVSGMLGQRSADNDHWFRESPQRRTPDVLSKPRIGNANASDSEMSAVSSQSIGRSPAPCSSPGLVARLSKPILQPSVAEKRIQNIDKLLTYIEDLSLKQLTGGQLNENEVAMVGRRSPLLEERASLLQ